MNLLTNAAKYTEVGGRIRLSAKNAGDHVVITVCDNGIGIPPDKLPEMFQLFTQGERSIARSEGGLGIGLTIVQKLAEMHGGTVSAESEGLGKGSEFTLRLPLARQSWPKAPKSSASATPIRDDSRILIVDDNLDSAEALARLLALLGNDVQLAHDGPTALVLASSFQPKFVLLDIGLPGMDGYEVAAKLREEPSCKSAVLIAVSGFGQTKDRMKSQEAGIDVHLVKPVDLDALLSVMDRMSSYR